MQLSSSCPVFRTQEASGWWLLSSLWKLWQQKSRVSGPENAWSDERCSFYVCEGSQFLLFKVHIRLNLRYKLWPTDIWVVLTGFIYSTKSKHELPHFLSNRFLCFKMDQWSWRDSPQLAWQPTARPRAPFCGKLKISNLPSISSIINHNNCFTSLNINTFLIAWWEFKKQKQNLNLKI